MQSELDNTIRLRKHLTALEPPDFQSSDLEFRSAAENVVAERATAAASAGAQIVVDPESEGGVAAEAESFLARPEIERVGTGGTVDDHAVRFALEQKAFASAGVRATGWTDHQFPRHEGSDRRFVAFGSQQQQRVRVCAALREESE